MLWQHLATICCKRGQQEQVREGEGGEKEEGTEAGRRLAAVGFD